jgi:CBS domain-containing protein
MWKALNKELREELNWRIYMENMFDDVLNSPVSFSMRQGIVTVSPTEPVSGLTYMMVKEDIGAVIVIENGRPVGIITEKDVIERVVMPGGNIYKTRAGDVMSRPVISIDASSPLRKALEIMRKNDIRRLAVMEKDSLVGLVTERRLLAKIGNLIV